MIKKNEPNLWVITEGMAGTENQCLGVAQALGLAPTIHRVKLNAPWHLIPPFLPLEHKSMFNPPLAPPWPDILITSGRKAVSVARYIKKASGGKTYTVHIQDPRTSQKTFDLIAVPEHDPTRGNNVITTLGAPNIITPNLLGEAKEKFKAFEKFSSPRIGVLIGGTSKAYTMSMENTQSLIEKLSALNGHLMITASRRTGEENANLLRKELDGDNIYFWDGTGDNPYRAILAYADVILVTADSTSMLSEAATTGKPVYIIPLEGGKKRIQSMHQNLIDHGAARFFEGKLEHWTYEPLQDAHKVALEIKKRCPLFMD